MFQKKEDIVVGTRSKDYKINKGIDNTKNLAPSKNKGNSKEAKATMSKTVQGSGKNIVTKSNQPDKKALAISKKVASEKPTTSINSFSSRVKALDKTGHRVHLIDSAKNDGSFVAKRTRSNKSRKQDTVSTLKSTISGPSRSSTETNTDHINTNLEKDNLGDTKKISTSIVKAKNMKNAKKDTKIISNVGHKRAPKQNKKSQIQAKIEPLNQIPELINFPEKLSGSKEKTIIRPGVRKRRIVDCTEEGDEQISNSNHKKREEKVPRLANKEENLKTNRKKDKSLEDKDEMAKTEINTTSSNGNSILKTNGNIEASNISANGTTEKSADGSIKGATPKPIQKYTLKADAIAELLDADDDAYR